LPPPLRPAAQAVSLHAMRYLGRARPGKQHLIARKPADPLLDAQLLPAFSLLVVDERETAASDVKSAPHTVVEQAVRAASGQRSLAPFKGLVNGSLRRFLRERDGVLAAVARRPEAVWNHPEWWVRRLRIVYPDHWEALLRAANQPPAMVL